MNNKIKLFISKLKNNVRCKLVLYWSIVLLVFLYVFSIPSFSGREKWNIISYVLMFLLGLITIIYSLLYLKSIFNRLLIVPLFFVVYAFLGTALFSHEFRRWATLLLMVITMYVLYYAFLAINNFRLVFKILIFAFFAFGIYFLFVYRNEIINIDFSYLRLGGYFDNLNTIGFYFAIASSLSLFTGIIFKRRRELLYLLPFVFFFVMGFLTGSRAFILIMITGILLVIFFSVRKKKWIFIISAVALVAALIILINIVPALSFLKTQLERSMFTLFGIGNSKIDTSTVQRVIYPQYAWYLAGNNAIIGYGCNGFEIFSGVGTYSHNNFAEVICCFGIMGFALHYFSYFLPLFCAFKPKDRDIYLTFVLVALYLIRSIFSVTYYTKDSYLILAICYYLIHDSASEMFLRNKRFFRDNNYYVEVVI